MKKILFLVAVCLLAVGMMAQSTPAQSNTQQQSADQAQANRAGQPASVPQGSTDTPHGRSDNSTASEADRSRSNAAGQDQAAPRDSNPQGNEADTTSRGTTNQSGITNDQPRRAGLPWGWIIVGIIVLAIIVGFATRGRDTTRVDRVDRVERIERHDDDDIRRVG